MTQDIKQLYIDAGQGHLFNHWDSLTSTEQSEFLSSLQTVANRIHPRDLITNCQKAIKLADTISHASPESIRPLPTASYESIINAKNDPIESHALATYRQLGHHAIEKGEVAVILMAGGQGTRLGSNEPKGCYDVGLPSHKSLFQMQAEKIHTLQRITNSKRPIPWFIMTSEPTRMMTERFFDKHGYFGLTREQVQFFNQGTLPALDSNGEKLLLKDKVHLVQSPDGNGGLYQGLKENGIIDKLIQLNVKHVYVYCVDNILSKIADPVFIGFAIKHGFQLATKAVRKRDPHESVGLIATRDDKPCVIEYSEISKELAEDIDSNGLLRLRAGNIVNHYYSVDLLRKSLNSWCDMLPYHIAKKKIPYFDNDSMELMKPGDKSNGIKLEQFIFDVFPNVPLEKFGCLEVERSIEFAPLKNGPGSSNDNPETSKLAFLQLGTNWLRENNAIIKNDVLVEVSNKLSYDGENLEKFNGHVFEKQDVILDE
ncbi:UDP-N-acetylglucosamine diphosphorylase NDAI_0B03240 [Naumovozyma dairenensis CBS 421]|uniref:UDP-N-acetylglucosamine diphosphorylase n=1 Tax=Naumovozyma dairenensis (strain ATCC 10597 / BCRC 20456 / CBS 421 / NBRC 0211 / NRRL Y-12639) TaxID=1071378 RepID=G0W6E8_NAUDC|nr:hypothetical protein NDAI_0B03240 [Naumovozyma dairenensis CBS 421]CCD23359.1 hypothetical protein NDAI_0B03240 [Naumovozyma dairenensis CBS 421]